MPAAAAAAAGQPAAVAGSGLTVAAAAAAAPATAAGIALPSVLLAFLLLPACCSCRMVMRQSTSQCGMAVRGPGSLTAVSAFCS